MMADWRGRWSEEIASEFELGGADGSDFGVRYHRPILDSSRCLAPVIEGGI